MQAAPLPPRPCRAASRLIGCALLCSALFLASAVRPAGGGAAGAEARLAASTVYTNAPRLAPGAVTVRTSGYMAQSGDLDDYDVTPTASISDPLEPWNRFWFHFNDIFYMYVAKPAYNAWVYMTPHQLRSGLSNFFANLLFPMRFVNNILQFRFLEAGVEFGRFLINTTSSLGFANVAKDKKTIVPVDPYGEDFGQTLGRWGVGHGFYVVWPFIGPSSVRDTVGRVGDCFTDPIFYVHPWELATSSELALRFNDLGAVLPLYDDLNSAAVDPYIAMREAYINFRNAQVKH